MVGDPGSFHAKPFFLKKKCEKMVNAGKYASYNILRDILRDIEPNLKNGIYAGFKRDFAEKTGFWRDF